MRWSTKDNSDFSDYSDYSDYSENKVVDFQEGAFVYINKPYRMSSFGALAHVRYLLSKRLHVRRLKTGHAGTLDPLATGVLILCTGKATKQIESLQLQTKEYTATLQLGATTASFDREHTVDMTYPTRHITRELITDVLAGFVGEIQQVPPVYSACNIAGDRAYKLARKGEQVQLAAKPIRIDELEMTAFDPQTMQLSIRVVCGKGTYIRSLARDIGRALGSGAFLTALCRTRVGNVRIEDCLTFDDLPHWLDEVVQNTQSTQNTQTSQKTKTITI